MFSNKSYPFTTSKRIFKFFRHFLLRGQSHIDLDWIIYQQEQTESLKIFAENNIYVTITHTRNETIFTKLLRFILSQRIRLKLSLNETTFTHNSAVIEFSCKVQNIAGNGRDSKIKFVYLIVPKSITKSGLLRFLI